MGRTGGSGRETRDCPATRGLVVRRITEFPRFRGSLPRSGERISSARVTRAAAGADIQGGCDFGRHENLHPSIERVGFRQG